MAALSDLDAVEACCSVSIYLRGGHEPLYCLLSFIYCLPATGGGDDDDDDGDDGDDASMHVFTPRVPWGFDYIGPRPGGSCGGSTERDHWRGGCWEAASHQTIGHTQ